MTLEEFVELFVGKKSHETIDIACERCHEIRHPLKTRAQQTIKKRGQYLCPSCGQCERHIRKPMTDGVKQSISEGVKRYYR